MNKLTRREFNKLGLGLGTIAVLGGPPAMADNHGLIKRPIPSSGEMMPIIGLGTNRYGVGYSAEEREPLVASLKRFHALGGTCIDTAPSYRTSEAVLGDLMADLEIRGDMFVATKIDRENHKESGPQMKASLQRLRIEQFDLVQVHNLKNWEKNVPVILKAKEKGTTRYTGITGFRASQLEEMEKAMRAHPDLDFIQINYSLEQREAAERVMPLARELGMAVMLNRTFGAGRMFSRLRDMPLPEWTAEFDCTSWAQFLLKYALSHPAATVAIPGMTKVPHVEDNLMGGQGRMPTAEQRQQMEAFYDAL